MIGLVTGWLLQLKVPAGWARPVAIGLITLAALLVLRLDWGLWLSAHDRAVVTADRAAVSAQVLNDTIAADRGAGAAKDGRDAAFRNEQTNLQEKADAAADNGASPLDAVLDGLR